MIQTFGQGLDTLKWIDIGMFEIEGLEYFLEFFRSALTSCLLYLPTLKLLFSQNEMSFVKDYVM